MLGPVTRSALRRMRARPVRTALTLLQLVLGTFAMTLALSALLAGPRAAGTTAPSERFDVAARIDNEGGGYRIYSLFDRERLAEFLALAPDVELAGLSSGFGPRAQVDVDGVLYQFDQTAVVTPEFFAVEGLVPSRGAFFGAAEAAAEEPVLVISDEAARILFDEADPVGRELVVVPNARGLPPGLEPPPATAFRVVGTFTPPAADDLTAFLQPAAYFPLWNDGTGLRRGLATHLSVLARPGRAQEAREQALAAAAAAYGPALEQRDLDASALQVVEASQPPLSLGPDPTAVIFAVFGLVAIIAGAIGIFSITVVDVVERTHEIGLRRALGASSRRITLELATEAALQAAAGALAGVLLAVALLPVIDRGIGGQLFLGRGLSLDPLAALAVAALVVVTGGLLALFPAAQAGRSRPVEALREA